MDPCFAPPTEPPRRKSKVSLSQLLAHIRSTDQREGIQGFIFNSPAPSVASSRNSSFSRRRSSCMTSDNRRSSNRSILLVTSESDSDYECHSALTASSIGSFTRKGSGTPSHLRCIVEVDGEKPTLTVDCNRALSLPNHTRQRRPPPLGLRCAVDISRDPSLLMLDTWTFSSAEGQSDIKTPSSVDSFKCNGMPFDGHVESTILLPLEKAPRKPPMSAPATDRAAVFRTDMSAGPPPINGATRPRQSSVGETEKKPRPLPLPTRMATYPSSNMSQNHQPFDAPPDYSLVDPSLEVQCVKASRRRGGLFSPLPGGNHTQQLVKQSSPPRLDVQTLPPDENGPPRTVRQKIKSGIASMHGKSNSQESAPRKSFGDASSRNNSLEGGQRRKISLPKTLRKKSTGSRKKSLPSAWFDDDECTDESGDEQLGVTLIVPAGIQQHKRAPLSTRTLTTNPFFDPNFSFSRRCQPRLSVSEAPAPRRYL